MKFHYVASQTDGRVIEGDLEAQGTAEVLEFLSSRALKPISIKVSSQLDVGGRPIFRARITITDQVFLTKYLSLMLKVGTDLFSAIDILIADFEKPVLKAFLGEIRANLEKGRPFYLSFLKYPNVFDQVFVNLVRAGEASGNLDKIFGDLSVFLQKRQDLRSRIRGALIYPTILLVLSTVILFVMVTFVLPQIASIFEGSDFTPPLFSRIVFTVGFFFRKYLLVLLALVIAAGLSLFYFYRTNVAFRMLNLRLVGRLPVVKSIIQKIAVQRFASTFASLMRAGLPITESIEITAYAVGNEEMKNSLMRISREGLVKGLTIGEAFKREPAFPRVVSNLIAISEKAGHVEDVLTTLSDFYEAEIDNSLKALVSFLEPLLLLIIGVVIGAIALSIIIPIYQLITQF